jgi:hypothetical protein
MRKDNFQQWLSAKSKQFELAPAEGLFDVTMRKRKNERRQRKLSIGMRIASLALLITCSVLWLILSEQSLPQATPSRVLSSVQPKPLNLAKNKSDLFSKKPKLLIGKTQIPTAQTKLLQLTQQELVTTLLKPNFSKNYRSKNNEISIQNNLFNNVMWVNEDRKDTAINKGKIEVLDLESKVKLILESNRQSKDSFEEIKQEHVSFDTANSPLSLTLLAQTDSNILPKVKQQKWGVMAVFTPQVVSSVYNANSDATLSWMKKYISNKEQQDKAQYSWNFGAKIFYHLNQHWLINTGILYSKIQFEEIKLVNKLRKDTSSVFPTGQDPYGNLEFADQQNLVVEVAQNSFDISFSSLEIPLQLTFQTKHKKMLYQISAGASYSYLIATRSLVFNLNDSLNVQETNDASNSRLTRHSLLILAGGAVGYQINSNLSAFAGPVFRYSLNSIYSKDYIIKQRPYYLGMEFGLKYFIH